MTEWSAKEYQEYVKTGKEPRRDKKPRKGKNKYKAISCQCESGHRHDSRGEASCCNVLHAMLEDCEIETQKTFTFYVNDIKVTSHRVDFLVTYKDGSQKVYEFKGFERPEWRIKHKLFEALYPEIPYIVVRQRDLNSMMLEELEDE